MLRAHSVAANSGDVAEIVLSVPEKGMSLVQPNGETTVIDRPMMEKHLRTFFERTQPDTYVYGIRIRSVNGEDEDSITLTLATGDFLVPGENNSWLRERKNGRPKGRDGDSSEGSSCPGRRAGTREAKRVNLRPAWRSARRTQREVILSGTPSEGLWLTFLKILH